jgi:hypothetical protein
VGSGSAPARREIPRVIRWTNNLALVVVDTIILRLSFPILAVGLAVMAEDSHRGHRAISSRTELVAWAEQRLEPSKAARVIPILTPPVLTQSLTVRESTQQQGKAE